MQKEERELAIDDCLAALELIPAAHVTKCIEPCEEEVCEGFHSRDNAAYAAVKRELSCLKDMVECEKCKRWDSQRFDPECEFCDEAEAKNYDLHSIRMAQMAEELDQRGGHWGPITTPYIKALRGDNKATS